MAIPGSGSAPMPIPQGSSSARANSVGRSLSTRRTSQSQGASGLGRRPSRVTHPPPVPPRALSHDEALEALRGFLKERSSYDVFPVSFRLIVLDARLKVKKALDVMSIYSE
jgi:5'-AMP-activated protein kinase regulatory gamma subunit